jgi:hypothetical protein
MAAGKSPQSLGGEARAKSLSKEERSAIARKSAATRWAQAKNLPVATHGSPERPLRIGDIEIPCFVLEDGRRVLIQTGVINALGMSHGGSYSKGGDRLAKFATQGRLSSFVSSQLVDRTAEPIRFRTSRGSMAYGYEATILHDLCEVVLDARDAGVLQKQQMHIAKQCETLVRGFARVGIIALVDEATGYQEDRDRDELHRILEAYLSEERLAWAKRFPDEFYKQIYRLKSWKWPPVGRAKPPLLGHITNDIVYDRLPPGVLVELQKRNPTDEETKRRKWKHHQFLSTDFGQPDLRDHLLQVIAVMRVSRNWEAFKRNFDEAFPKPGTQMEFRLNEDEHAF